MSEEQKYANRKLVSACMSGDISLARYLLEEGFAEINCYSMGNTPLTATLKNKNTNMANFLLNFPGVKMEQPDDLGRTPLHFACYHGLIELIRSLIPHLTSCSINRRDSYGRSPIMAAVELGKVEAVKEMIKVKEVNLRTTNMDGESLIEVARKNGFPEISHIFYNQAVPRVSTPSVPGKTRDKGSVPNQLAKSKETTPPQPQDFGVMEDLELIHTEANDVLDLKHMNQIEEVNEDINVLKQMFENQIKERKALRLNQQQERLVAISHMKPKPPSVECPICLDDMDPNKKIFQCMNGHLVCQPCQTRLPSCSLCKKNIIGRAIAMEQFLRTLHNI